MLYRVVLFTLLAIAGYTVFSQLSGVKSNYKKLYADAEQLYANPNSTPASDSAALLKYQAVIKQLSTSPPDDSLLFDSYVKCGLLLSSFTKDSLATRQFIAAITLNNSAARLHDSLSFVPWLFAGSSYYNLFNPDSALYCYKQAELLLQQYPHLKEGERLYNKTGVLYYEAGDYKRSVYYFSKALSLVDTTQTGNRFFVVNYKNNIASAYRKLQLYDDALTLYNSLLHFGFYRNELLHNIGVTYLDKGNAAAAIHYLQKASYTSAARYNDLARAYLLQQDAGNTRANLQLALASYTTTALQRGPDYANTYKLSGDLAMRQKQPASALSFYHKAILATATGFTDTLPSANPAVFSNLNHFYFLFNTIAAKANAYLALNESKSTQLAHAFNTYKSALTLSAYMEKSYGTDDTKMFLKRNVEPVYKKAVETGLDLFLHTGDEAVLSQVFAYVENSKASVLQLNITDAELGKIKGMPVQLLSEEKSIKARLNSANLLLTQAADSTQVIAIQQQIQDAAIKLARVQQQLNDNSNYSRLKYAAANLPVQDIQKKILDNRTAVLSYYLTGSNIVCFYITGKQFGFVKNRFDSTLLSNIAGLNIQLPLGEGADNNKIANTTAVLYQQLVKPVDDKLAGISRLIIIPHNELSYIPFELLSDKNGDPLLQRYAISYQYSANFLSQGNKTSGKYNVLEVAPFANFGGSTGAEILPASNKEVQGLPGKQLIDTAATKTAFLQNAAVYPVIHLATHATANDSLPLNGYIQFYRGENARLYEPEIYQLNLVNTRLAILSACETGSGQLIKSEGLISLSRAFSYAGCKSVVTSLWKANDVATAFICNRLHTYLQSGYGIDEALQKAKMDYLQSSKIEQRFKKPAYWANLVLMGDAHAITNKPNNWLLIIAAIAFVIAAIVFVTKKKPRHNTAVFMVFDRNIVY